MVYIFMFTRPPLPKCKVINCDSVRQAKGVCKHHRWWSDFSKPDDNLPKKRILNRSHAKVLGNMNDFVFDNFNVRLILLSTIENPIPDHIEAIPSENKAKYLGVKFKLYGPFLYRIGYNGNKWEVGSFKTAELAGKAFAYAKELLNVKRFGDGWEFYIYQLHGHLLWVQ
jgi:hypothetical protein